MALRTTAYPFYAMELLEGESLARSSRGEGALAPARAVHLVAQAARALAEAHAKGIVHRDVKPENIFVATIAGQRDFRQSARFRDREGAHRGSRLEADEHRLDDGDARVARALKRSAARRSTRAPMSMRWARCSISRSPARQPFESSNGAYVVSAHLHDLPAPPSEKRGGPIGNDVEAVVMHCLEKSPDAR